MSGGGVWERHPDFEAAEDGITELDGRAVPFRNPLHDGKSEPSSGFLIPFPAEKPVKYAVAVTGGNSGAGVNDLQERLSVGRACGGHVDATAAWCVAQRVFHEVTE